MKKIKAEEYMNWDKTITKNELSPLEAFNKIKNDSYKTYEEECFCYEIVGKSLKALEIIKEKRCDIYLLMECERLEHYNENDYLSSDQALTQEEFDLLKEVLQ